MIFDAVILTPKASPCDLTTGNLDTPNLSINRHTHTSTPFVLWLLDSMEAYLRLTAKIISEFILTNTRMATTRQEIKVTAGHSAHCRYQIFV